MSSRFDQYKSESDLPELRKLEVGESFTARLFGDHPYEGDNGPVPVLEFVDGAGVEFGWIAGSWHAREQLAVVDPQVNDTVTVSRLADRGRSHQYSITIVQPAAVTAPAPSEQGGGDDDIPW